MNSINFTTHKHIGFNFWPFSILVFPNTEHIFMWIQICEKTGQDWLWNLEFWRPQCLIHSISVLDLIPQILVCDVIVSDTSENQFNLKRTTRATALRFIYRRTSLRTLRDRHRHGRGRGLLVASLSLSKVSSCRFAFRRHRTEHNRRFEFLWDEPSWNQRIRCNFAAFV